jgi:hypothetical protein
MKKCPKCSYETKNSEYKICPICGEKLIETKETKLYMVGITKGQPVSSPIRLTKEEAELIKRISEELAENTGAYNTKLWIEFK